jgi:phospholipase/carboxylesterase
MALTPGLHPLGIGHGRDGLISVPASYRDSTPVPLMIMLHGAGADAARILPSVRRQSEMHGFLLVAPESRGRTWDAVLGAPGPDVTFLDETVKRIFERATIRGDRIALAGFSDGGTYALSLGLANGTQFRHILAFSPGFVTSLGQAGHPRIFMSHGTADPVLPIDRCSRTIHRTLVHGGYDVTYREFEGEHIIPPVIAEAAVTWWLGPDGTKHGEPRIDE